MPGFDDSRKIPGFTSDKHEDLSRAQISHAAKLERAVEKEVLRDIRLTLLIFLYHERASIFDHIAIFPPLLELAAGASQPGKELNQKRAALLDKFRHYETISLNLPESATWPEIHQAHLNTWSSSLEYAVDHRLSFKQMKKYHTRINHVEDALAQGLDPDCNAKELSKSIMESAQRTTEKARLIEERTARKLRDLAASMGLPENATIEDTRKAAIKRLADHFGIPEEAITPEVFKRITDLADDAADG